MVFEIAHFSRGMAFQSDRSRLITSDQHHGISDGCPDPVVVDHDSSADGGRETISSKMIDIDTSSLSMPQGNIHTGTDGEVYSVNQETSRSVHLAFSNDPERSTPWMASGDVDSIGNDVYSPSIEESLQFNGLGECWLERAASKCFILNCDFIN